MKAERMMGVHIPGCGGHFRPKTGLQSRAFFGLRLLAERQSHPFRGWPFILALSLFALSCGSEQKARWELLVSPKSVSATFWLTVKSGAEKAAEEFDVRLHWKGPAQETDVAGQVAILEDYINKKIDAIVFAATDRSGLVGIVEKARSAGIPVITIDSGVESDIPVSLIATDNIEGSRRAARALSDLLGAGGKVACLPFVPGAATSIMREEGFRNELTLLPGLELVAVQYSQSDVATAMAVTENILTAHPDLAGIYAANEPGAIGAAQALVGRGLAGKVKIVAFDAAPNEIAALESGTIQALVVQNPFLMGYLGVKAAVETLEGKRVEKRIDTGVTVVTPDNLHFPEIQALLAPGNRQNE